MTSYNQPKKYPHDDPNGPKPPSKFKNKLL